MNDHTRVSASQEQLSCRLGGDIAILNLRNSTYYTLNPVGARVWELLQSPTTVAELRNAIIAEYDIDQAKAQQDLTNLLTELERHELLIIVEDMDG